MKRAKIALIGGGFVGSACAHWILSRDLGDIVLLDLKESLMQGRALDLMQSAPLNGVDLCVEGASEYKKIQNADVVVVTAGKARQSGMSREDLKNLNAQVIKAVCQEIRTHAPQAVVIIVTNPLDVMTYLAWKVLAFPSHRVMGMAGVLDSARFRCFIAQELKVSVQDVQAYVLGGHGDSMVPLARLCQVGGIPLKDLLPESKIQALIERTQKGGQEIVSYLKEGSAYYAPALSVVEMVESILKDKNRLLPCSAYLKGEFQVKDLFMGVPCVIGRSGVKKVMDFPLQPGELALFKKSASVVYQQVKSLKTL